MKNIFIGGKAAWTALAAGAGAIVLLVVLMAPAGESVVAREKTVGIIIPQGSPYEGRTLDVVKNRLKRLGESSRLRVVIQNPYPDLISLKNAARKMIALEVDVIVAFGGASVMSALKERPAMPVLYAGLYAPLSDDISPSDATGVVSRTPAPSLLRHLRKCGGIKKIAVFYGGWDEESVFQLNEIRNAAKKYQVEVAAVNIKHPADITGVSIPDDADGFIITTFATMGSVYKSILSISRTLRVPTASLVDLGPEKAVITLSPDYTELGSMAADRLAALLEGNKVKALGVANAESQLIFNMRLAREIGVNIPMSVIAEATEVIE